MDRICPRCHQRYPATNERCPLHDLPLRADPFIGAPISRWTLTGFIGQGAMGVVYRAEPAAAIKILNARRAAMQPDLVRRFEVEAEAATRLQSPHIARIFESGTTDDGHLYIAMELLRGAPLDEILKRLNRVAADGAATIAYQAAHALAEAHDKAIVHRDLKPANLFAEPIPGGGGAHIRVLDFGVARINTESVARSRTGSVVGTPAYMSPEQLRGEVDIDGRSDVYSLGVVLYRLLAGFNPFRGEGGVLDTLRRHVEIIPAPLPPDVPPALAELTFDMLAKHRDARPPSMHAVRARLEGTGLIAAASDEATLELATIPSLDGAAVGPKARENETTIGAGELRSAAAAPTARPRWWVPVAAAVVVAGGAIAWLTQREDEEPPDRFVIASRLLDAGAPAPALGGVAPDPASPVAGATGTAGGAATQRPPEPVVPPPVDVGPDLAEAERLAAAENWDGAIAAYDRVLIAKPADDTARAGRDRAIREKDHRGQLERLAAAVDDKNWAVALDRLGDVPQDSVYAARVAELRPRVEAGHADAEYKRGRAMVDESRLDDAEKLATALAARPYAQDAAQKLRDDINRARATAAEVSPAARSIRPRPAPEPIHREAYQSFLERGLQAMGRGDRPAALVLFEKAREANPTAKVPYQRLCAIYKAQEMYARALPNCERWLAMEENAGYRVQIQRTIDQLRDRLGQ